MSDLSTWELHVLAEAKASNLYWFYAMTAAAAVQVERRLKYSGGVSQGPFTNFTKMAQLLGKPVDEVFRFYCAIKMSRLAVTDSDHADESVDDTLVDLANYALLWRGYRGREGSPGSPPTVPEKDA